MPKKRLAIHPAPFKSSHLSIPPSPFSPLSPLTPAARPKTRTPSASLIPANSTTRAVPATPLQWIWTCHACHSAYPLGATRRCLDDGHHFCAGNTMVKRWHHDDPKRRVKRHKACVSEFDYLGWKGWGRWKRASLVPRTSAKVTGAARAEMADVSGVKEQDKKNCWMYCDYPSQCRWGKRVGIHTPSSSPTPTRTTFSFHDSSINTSVLNRPIDSASLDDCFVASSPPDTGLKCDVSALGRALEASAKRRKSIGSVSPTSPLPMEFSQTSVVFEIDMVDAGDVAETLPAMLTPTTVDESCIDPALLTLSNVGTSYTPSTSASVPEARVTDNEHLGAISKLKTLLFLSAPKSSRRHIALLPVSNAKRRLKRRHAMSGLTLQAHLDRHQDQLVEDLSPLEGARRRDESALNVV